MYFTAITVFCPSFSLSPLLQGDDLYEVRRPYSMLSKTETRFFIKRKRPALPPVPNTGVWLPPSRFSKTPFPRKPISAFNALRFRFPKLFSLSMIVRRFPFSLSVLALFCKTLSGLTSVLRRLYPTKRAVLLIASLKLFTSRAEAFALLSFYHLTGSPLEQPSLESISLPKTPFSLLNIIHLTMNETSEPQGFSVVYLAISHYGRRPAGCF